MKHKPIYYSEYLELNKILNAQNLKSTEHGKEAHDETLFIIIHQTYELWFKQIIHELDSVYSLFNKPKVEPNSLGKIIQRLGRIIEIQKVLNEQISIIETMTPLDFMEFRDYLVPASGFQSIQFRTIELKLGLRQKYRLGIDQQFFNSRLKQEDKDFLQELENAPTLLELVDNWLTRMPFGESSEYNFWKEYESATQKMLDSDQEIIEKNVTLSEKETQMELKNLKATRESFDNLFYEERFNKIKEENNIRLSRKALLSCIFIKLFKDEPILQLPNKILEQLVDIDEYFTTWRYRHAIMAHRLLGTKIGTGGSSGHDYLKRSTENNRVFTDLFNLATFLLPKTYIPNLPSELKDKLGFIHEK